MFVALLALLSALLICILGFQYSRERRFRIEMLDTRLQLFNAGLGEALRNGIAPDEYIARQTGMLRDVRVTLIDTLGNVLYDSEEDVALMPNHADRQEVRQAISNGYGYTTRRMSAGNGNHYFYSASRIDNRIIRSALSYRMPLGAILRSDIHFIAIMIAIAAVMSIIAFYYTRRLGQNIVRLREFAMRADRGEEIADIKPFAADELGEVSNHIVQLYSQLQRAKDDLCREHEQVLREQEEKTIIKRQLTNNINHELKTPVSSIKGYLETIINNPDLPNDKLRTFVEKSYAQSERLLQLLQDVSTLTRMDEGGQVIQRSQVDLCDIIREVAAEVALRPPLDRMRINCDFLDRQMPLYGNQQLLLSIFRNLTDNAIAYSCGRDIFIELTGESDSCYSLRFSDNGVGVEPEHLGRIFERFYRVDKGRSRKQGGTGLGLAIVKNAVMFHGGTITASLRKDGGLAFDFTLNKR